MDTFPLQLDRYFFTETVVRANPGYTPSAGLDGGPTPCAIAPVFSCLPIEGRADAFAVEVSIRADDTKTGNLPYSFSISAFAIFVSTPELPADAALALAQTTGFGLLIGAIREHLGSITARGPWGPFLLGPIPLVHLVTTQPPTTEPVTPP